MACHAPVRTRRRVKRRKHRNTSSGLSAHAPVIAPFVRIPHTVRTRKTCLSIHSQIKGSTRPCARGEDSLRSASQFKISYTPVRTHVYFLTDHTLGAHAKKTKRIRYTPEPTRPYAREEAHAERHSSRAFHAGSTRPCARGEDRSPGFPRLGEAPRLVQECISCA
jgi:hypothetical protein